ncbi:MAG: Hsp20/alpha crystallin family protein [Verrucomicrobia bacterium]|nr:Hsp20/alpha crystallin family protein [Verrucomicrobiota bacterium]
MNIVQQQQQNENKVAPRPEEHHKSYLTPVVDVQSTQDGFVLQAEMPGVDKSGLEITVDNSELVITGHRRPLEKVGEPSYREIRWNDFRRVYELDPSIDAEAISAKMENGVLTITLPKAESVKPRKITVQ